MPRHSVVLRSASVVAAIVVALLTWIDSAQARITRIVIDRTALGHPVKLDRIAKRTWTIQAVMDVTPGSYHRPVKHAGLGSAPGRAARVWPARRGRQA